LIPGVLEVQELTTREKMTRAGIERAVMPMSLTTLGGADMISVVVLVEL